jgi:hypothetical protein
MLNYAAGEMFLIIILGTALLSARWRTKAKAMPLPR